jgi:hypothetical protein
MTTERYIIAALSIACIALAWVVFAPSPNVPTEDPERWRVEERMRMREAQLEVARDSIVTLKAEAVKAKETPRKKHTPNHEQTRKHWNLSDSLSAELALEVLRTNLPDTARGEVGRIAE